MASRAQAGKPTGEKFIHLLFGQQSLDAAEDLGQRRCAAASFF
jgi:hypothetical protein